MYIKPTVWYHMPKDLPLAKNAHGKSFDLAGLRPCTGAVGFADRRTARLIVAEKRDRQCKVWLSESEYSTLKSGATLAGMSIADYIVDCCNNQRRTFSLAKVPGNVKTNKPKKLVGFDDSQERVVRKCIRVTPAENEFIKECSRRAGMTETKFIVTRTIATPIRFIGSPDFFKPFLYELNKIGVNFNQLVASVNRLNLIAERPDISAVRIESLAEEIRSDNERTRAILNDTVLTTYKLMDSVHSAMEDPSFEDVEAEVRLHGAP